MGVLDLLFPVTCLNCGKTSLYICDECLAKVPKPKLFCVECKKASIDGATHAKCKKKLSADFVVSCWNYEGVIRKAIIKLKYNFAYDLAQQLSLCAIGRLKRIPILPQKGVLTAIPLHRLRRNWRGFNQSEVIGKLLAKDLGWHYLPDLLIRKKFTKPQVELKGKQRESNVAGIFAFNSRYKLLSDDCIVFDDVLTTGSTIKEAAKVLKRNKAKRIWGLAIAS